MARKIENIAKQFPESLDFEVKLDMTSHASEKANKKPYGVLCTYKAMLFAFDVLLLRIEGNR